jgi:uncharacterized membrane protein SpoIIM required for sporulation
MAGTVFRALSRARLAILTVALTYVLSVIVGAVMVHTGNEFALNYVDDLVARAAATEPSIAALRQGDRLRAALLDFGGNLFLGAVPGTLANIGVVTAFPLVAYRGWIGGVVSVRTDEAHTSRLAEPSEAVYYIVTLTLQLIPYSLAGGAGMNLGVASFRPKPPYDGEKWLTLPKEAIRDVFRIYLLVVPLFLVASLWEFLAR